jgi:hypothetical protein
MNLNRKRVRGTVAVLAAVILLAISTLFLWLPDAWIFSERNPFTTAHLTMIEIADWLGSAGTKAQQRGSHLSAIVCFFGSRAMLPFDPVTRDRSFFYSAQIENSVTAL